MEVAQNNRMIESDYQWPPVIITRSIPDHPEGAIRYPRPELRERWERLGICKPYRKKGRPSKK